MAQKSRQADLSEKLRLYKEKICSAKEEMAQNDKKIAAIREKNAQIALNIGEWEDKSIKLLLKANNLSFDEVAKILLDHAHEASNEESAAEDEISSVEQTNTTEEISISTVNQFSKGETENEEKKHD